MIIAAMLLSLMPLTVGAQGTEINSRDLRGKVVYQDDEVVFRQLDEQTWIGNGHRVYNESLYLVEGNDRAILIDAGTVIPGLDKIVAKITTKPVTMMLTHAHGDHAGGVGPFPEVYLNAGDMPLVSNSIEVLHRLYQLDDLLGLDGLCQDAAHDEGSEGRREAYFRGEYRHRTAQSERHDEQHLGVDEPSDLA